MSNLSVDNLLGIKYLNKNDLNLIFKTSDNFKEVINRKIKKTKDLTNLDLSSDRCPTKLPVLIFFVIVVFFLFFCNTLPLQQSP